MSKKRKVSFKIPWAGFWVGVGKFANLFAILGTLVGTYFAWLSLQNQEEIASLKEIAVNTGKNEEKIASSLDSFGVIIRELRLENLALSDQIQHLSEINQNSQSQTGLTRKQLNQYLENTQAKLSVSELGVNSIDPDSMGFFFNLTNFGGSTAFLEGFHVVWCTQVELNDFKVNQINTRSENVMIYPGQKYSIDLQLKKTDRPLEDEIEKTIVFMRLFFRDNVIKKSRPIDVFLKPTYVFNDFQHRNLEKSEREDFEKYLRKENYFIHIAQKRQ